MWGSLLETLQPPPEATVIQREYPPASHPFLLPPNKDRGGCWADLAPWGSKNALFGPPIIGPAFICDVSTNVLYFIFTTHPGRVYALRGWGLNRGEEGLVVKPRTLLPFPSCQGGCAGSVGHIWRTVPGPGRRWPGEMGLRDC